MCTRQELSLGVGLVSAIRKYREKYRPLHHGHAAGGKTLPIISLLAVQRRISVMHIEDVEEFGEGEDP